jgi:hypothetical protein
MKTKKFIECRNCQHIAINDQDTIYYYKCSLTNKGASLSWSCDDAVEKILVCKKCGQELNDTTFCNRCKLTTKGL